MYFDYKQKDELVGHTMINVWKGKYEDSDALFFQREDGKTFVYYHRQDCCEGVWIEDICGELSDLVGSPMVIAEEAVSHGEVQCGSFTATFYTFATKKGRVYVRWYGESNGYYSESVDFTEVIKEETND